MVREYFAVRGSLDEFCPLELRQYQNRFDSIKALARFGFAEKDELCFCDQIPNAVREDEQSTILCSPSVSENLAQRAPRALRIVLDDARAVFIDLAHALLSAGLLEVSSLVDRSFGVAPSACIGSHSVIDPEVRIDDGVVIGSNCIVHRGVWLKSGVAIGDGTVVGNAGINAYRARDGRVLDFPHLAGVIVGEGTHIGANSVVVRGVLTSTRIDKGVVVGNLCNIGHGVEIGEKSWMSVGGMLGGHTVLGKQVTVGMAATVRDNLKIGEFSQIGMGAVVVKDVAPSSSVFGNPARPVPQISAGPKR